MQIIFYSLFASIFKYLFYLWQSRKRKKRKRITWCGSFLPFLHKERFKEGRSSRGKITETWDCWFCFFVFCECEESSRALFDAQDLQDVQAKYEASLVDIATSLQLSRNILIAILSLQSWKPFMRRWMRSHILLLDAKLQTAVLDKAPKAAMEILKVLLYSLLVYWWFVDFGIICQYHRTSCLHFIMQSMIAIAERMLPRSAENIALAVGSLCLVIYFSHCFLQQFYSRVWFCFQLID